MVTNKIAFSFSAQLRYLYLINYTLNRISLAREVFSLPCRVHIAGNHMHHLQCSNPNPRT